MDIARYRAAENRLFQSAGIRPVEHWLHLRSGLRVRLLEHGAGSPALFLHGGPNAGATWARVAAATRGLRCLMLDRSGCGLSGPPSCIPDARTLPRYVGDLSVEVLDCLGLDRAMLVGSSLGGYSALRTALDHHERVQSIVLVGCPAFVPGWTPPAFFALLRAPLLGRALLAAPATMSVVKRSLREMGHAGTLRAGRVDPAMLEWMLAWLRETHTMRNDAAMIIACGTWRRGFAPSLDLTERELARLHLPVRMLFGSDDPVGGRTVADALAAQLPHASVDVLSGAGHLPWLDDPTWTARGVEAAASASVTDRLRSRG